MVIEAGNASTSMADADSVGMVQRSTPDFIMDQAWPTPLASPDHFDATSVDMTIFHNAEDMQTSMTSLDDWFGSNNALQADIAGSFPPSWMPIPEATNSHQEAESSETAKPKRLGILPTPTSSFSSHASSAAAAAQETCSCLQHVVFIVHELETAKMDSMDGQMASHKEALDYGQAMVMCERCSRRPENLMMLTFLSERLLHLSEAVIGRLAELDGEDRLAFIFGELEIDSAPEWDLLASSLAALQLSGLGRLLAQLKKSAETARADTVYQKVVDTEKLAKELMERLRRTVKRLYA